MLPWDIWVWIRKTLVDAAGAVFRHQMGYRVRYGDTPLPTPMVRIGSVKAIANVLVETIINIAAATYPTS